MKQANFREITTHVVEGDSVNSQLGVAACGTPSTGGAHCRYEIGPYADGDMTILTFQSGPIKECGVNGITNETLLAVVLDRLRSFQNGPYACEENALAWQCANAALNALKSRTERRIKRGVEGTSAQ